MIRLMKAVGRVRWATKLMMTHVGAEKDDGVNSHERVTELPRVAVTPGIDRWWGSDTRQVKDECEHKVVQ